MKLGILIYMSILLLFILLVSTNAQSNDTMNVYYFDQIEVSTHKIEMGESSYSLRNNSLVNLLQKDGFNLIRRGIFFAEDIYNDGFKRGDVNVVIDGERYHSACPNRMDSPLTRINPLQTEAVELNKTCAHLQSGIGGTVTYKRSVPDKEYKLKTNLSVAGGASSNIDFSVLGDYSEQRITARYVKGKPYEDGHGNSFKDLYGYKENYEYMLAEGGVNGKVKSLEYMAAFTYTENVSFPYLRMDEIENKVFSGHLGYEGHKIYFNYTDHLMDNTLRVSPMLMETKAENLTVGVIGDFYEAFYRNWDLNNQFVLPNGNKILNHMMPDLSTFSGTIKHQLNLYKISFSGKLGLEYDVIGDKERLDFYKVLYSDADTKRIFINFGINANYLLQLSNNLNAGFLLEFASNAPDAQNLYISVKKPMGKPTWIGNPTLDQPFRSTLRMSLNHSLFGLELFGNHIVNYINLTQRAPLSSTRFLTYENINAALLGINAKFHWQFMKFDVSYNHGINLTDDSPLSEIQPFKATLVLESPRFSGFNGYIKNIFNSEQSRIDENLNETATPSWNRLDLGISYLFSGLNISLELENVFDKHYYQHLSYLRDPFASGVNVYEPGRTVMLSVFYGI